MYAELRHLDGARAGEVRVVQKDFVTIGRHASAEIGFDPERDLDVSGRHAAVFRQGESWVLRDLGSTNGTFVNGARLKGDRVLVPGDVIGFGPNGPRLRFRVAEGTPPSASPTRRDPDAQETAPMPRRRTPAAGAGRGRTTERVRVEVARRTTRWRRTAVLAIAAAVLVVATVGGVALQRTRALERQRGALLAEIDSLTARLQSTTSGIGALSAALAGARAETARLRRTIAEGGASPHELAALSGQVTASLGRHRGVLRAAQLDAPAITRDKAPAVALIVAELPDRRRVSGTGLTVRARGDTGWIVTSRHLVADSAGRRALRLGAIYHRTAQNFRAQLVRVSDSFDLALLTVRVRGGVPSAPELAPGATAGDPVAILGYPFGFEFPMGGDWRTAGVSASTFSGTVTRVSDQLLEIDGYGATGSSGSPAFNASGAVVGLVFGGERASHGRVLYAVPARAIQQILRETP